MRVLRLLSCGAYLALLTNILAFAQTTSQVQKGAFAKLWTSEIPEPLANKRPVERALIADCNRDGIDDLILWVTATSSGRPRTGVYDVFALDGATGKYLWTNQHIELTQLFQCDAIGHWMYFSDDQDTVKIIDLRTGKVRQDVTLLPRKSRWDKREGVLFICGKEHQGGVEIYAYRANLYEFTPFRACYLWLPEADGSAPLMLELSDGSPAAFTDSCAFLLTREALVAVDRSNGKYLWKNSGTGLVRISACGSDGKKIIVYDTTKLTIATFSAKTGQSVWTLKTGVCMDQGSAYDSPPFIGEKACAVYMGAYQGIGVLDMQAGQAVWKINTGESPVILSPCPKSNSFLVRTTKCVACYSLDNPHPLWQSFLKQPEVVMGKEKALLVGRKEDTIEAISLKEGSSLWKKKVPLARGWLFPLGLPSDVEISQDQRYAIVYSRKEIRVLSIENGEPVEVIGKEALKTIWPDGCAMGWIKADKCAISWRPFGEKQPRATGNLDSAVVDDLFVSRKALFVRAGQMITAYAHPHPAIAEQIEDAEDPVRDYMVERLKFIEYFSTVPR